MATSAGVVGALLPVELGVALAVFGLFIALFRIVSLGSMGAALALVVARLVLSDGPFAEGERALTAMAALLCGMVFLRHRGNVSRLLAGTESRIGVKPDTVSEGASPSAHAHEEEADPSHPASVQEEQR